MRSNGSQEPGPRTPDPRVDDLRRRLRSLGYLDAGVDRFVLGSARPNERPVKIALVASLRIGILAALLLGPAAAVGLAGRLPGLVTGPRDAVVAALYLGILFGASIALVSFVAAIVASWMATRTVVRGSGLVRRVRFLSIAAGIVVTAGSLVYLTLWWRTANGGLGWSSPLWTAFALAVAAAISLLLGHAVTITALAMVMARRLDDPVSARVPGMSWKASFAGTVLAFAGASVLLLATARETPAESPASLTVRSSGTRAIVLSIDGFDVQMYERLRRPPDPKSLPPLFPDTNYGLPVFDAARADLQSSDSRDPARLWTTIATGVRPETHGVSGLETRRVAGLQGRLVAGSTGRLIETATDVLRLTRPSIASNFERRVKTFWEVAEQAGLRTAIVNWWASWPAMPSGGIVFSDRAVLRLERGGGLDAELAPPELYEPLKAVWSDIRTTAQQQARSFFPMSLVRQPDLTEILTRSAELDISMMRIAESLSAGRNLDLLVVYLPGLDIAQHALLGGEPAARPAFELNLRLGALQHYYRFIEVLSGRTVAAEARVGQRVFVVTQAGRLHEGPGILAALGPGMHTGARGAGTILDIAPTILYALGVPVARDLDGRVLSDLFQPAFLAAHPVRHVDTYGLRRTIAVARGDAPLDQDMIDRLRSLGYVR